MIIALPRLSAFHPLGASCVGQEATFATTHGSLHYEPAKCDIYIIMHSQKWPQTKGQFKATDQPSARRKVLVRLSISLRCTTFCARAIVAAIATSSPQQDKINVAWPPASLLRAT